MDRKVTEIFFSPGGTVKNISNLFCRAFSDAAADSVDLLRGGQPEEKTFAPREMVVVSMPVFAGRIPETAAARLQSYRGTDTAAVAIVVYGNREYEDALLELTDILKSNGFNVLGAAAFIARHSIFPRVAAGRPDEKDKELIRSFARQCAGKAETGAGRPLSVTGNNPYRPYSSVPLRPKGSSACTGCGLCVKICPVKAIEADTPRKTDKKRCVSCTACIYSCPSRARSFGGLLYKIAGIKFKKDNAAYKKPELFV